MSRHATHRFWFCLLAGMGGLAVSLLTRSASPAALGAPFLTVLVLSWVDRWWPEATVVSVNASANRVVEGDQVDFDIGVKGRRTISSFELEVQFPANYELMGPARFVGALAGETQFQISTRAVRWGLAGPEWAVITTRDRFGVSEVVSRQPLKLPLRIHPPADYLRSLIPLSRDRSTSGEHHSYRIGPGSEMAEVRPYRVGDPLRMVNVRLSQRRGEVMVVERHPEHSSDVILLVDSGQDLGIDLDTTLRLTITAADAIGERHLGAQDRVGLLDIGWRLRWIPARMGRRHLHTIVDALLATSAQPPSLVRGEQESWSQLPAHLPRQATIVALSPLLSQVTMNVLVQLRNRGHEILVIKPIVSIDQTGVSDEARRLFLIGNTLNENWLTQRGVMIIPWRPQDGLDHIVKRIAHHQTGARRVVRPPTGSPSAASPARW